jgi:hypothetical protein
MVSEMTKLVTGAVGLVTDAIKHVAWYVSHQVHPDPRRRDSD